MLRRPPTATRTDTLFPNTTPFRSGAVAIGNFDGVHLGHRAVIERAGAMARDQSIPLGVLTFEPHPRQVFQPFIAPFRLSLLRAKAHLLEARSEEHTSELQSLMRISYAGFCLKKKKTKTKKQK